VALALYPVSISSKGCIEKTSVSRSEFGQKPHKTISREVELTGRVAKLDKEKRLASIQGKSADVSVEVAADVDIDSINVGDTVQLTYLEMVSISMNAPAPTRFKQVSMDKLNSHEKIRVKKGRWV